MGFPLFILAPLLTQCSIVAVRPAQDMSNMEVSLRAAKEVNADVLAPELFRRASEVSVDARKEYRFRNFESAKILANQAREYAERSEFEALRNGAKREVIPDDPLSEPSYAPEPIATPTEPAAGQSPPTASPTP